jgi:hypothetical protein
MKLVSSLLNAHELVNKDLDLYCRWIELLTIYVQQFPSKTSLETTVQKILSNPVSLTLHLFSPSIKKTIWISLYENLGTLRDVVRKEFNIYHLKCRLVANGKNVIIDVFRKRIDIGLSNIRVSWDSPSTTCPNYYDTTDRYFY